MIQPLIRFETGTIINLANMIDYVEYGEFEADDFSIEISFVGESSPRAWQRDDARLIRSHMVILVNAYHAMQAQLPGIAPANQPSIIVPTGVMPRNPGTH